MPVIRADLHTHSCLSPCGDLAASPRALAAAARKAGLDMLALTDHNTARNAPAFEIACRAEGVVPLFGVELTTREEVHALALFPTVLEAVRAGEEAYERLDSEPLNAEAFGDQIWVNEHEEIDGSLEKLLIIGTTDLSLEDAGPWTRELVGLFIPAHIDRPVFGVLGVLGFLPEGPFEAVECTREIDRALTGGWPVTASSDAHHPEDVGKRFTEWTADRADFDSLAAALASRQVTARCYGA